MTRVDPSTVPAAALSAPIHIGAVGLHVRDLNAMTQYYATLLGLKVEEISAHRAQLSIDDVVLLELVQTPNAVPDNPSEAGLYHTAFVMPTRADLARWLIHIARNRIPITGASDHDVSEAIYLDDPEGNGVEVYSDRPSERWRRDGQMIFQKTEQLDMDAIVAGIDPKTADYPSAPRGLRVGHVHLRVGDIATAEQFYIGTLGLDVTRRRTGATFVSSGGYHHHIAFNTWHSQRAGRRNERRTGLAWFELEVESQVAGHKLKDRMIAAGMMVEPLDRGFSTLDPWGTHIRVVAGSR